MITKGQRVQTPLGVGTVLGFEVFDAKGWPLPIVDEDPDNDYRVVVQLDEPGNWLHPPNNPHPYIYRSQLSEIKE